MAIGGSMDRRNIAAVIAALVVAGCSGGQAGGGDVSPEQAAAECQGAWAVQVQNQTYELVQVYYTRGSLGTRQSAGEVNPQDTKVLFFRSDPYPEVWATLGSLRIDLRDRAAQGRAKVYLALGCDTR
jgi:hypothetical protein